MKIITFIFRHLLLLPTYIKIALYFFSKLCELIGNIFNFLDKEVLRPIKEELEFINQEFKDNPKEQIKESEQQTQKNIK